MIRTRITEIIDKYRWHNFSKEGYPRQTGEQKSYRVQLRNQKQFQMQLDANGFFVPLYPGKLYFLSNQIEAWQEITEYSLQSEEDFMTLLEAVEQ